ncbi:hypothetical protein V6N13_112136 [Hibiscus sabdariffa]|uniref:Uncharacterized protein n=1 Tax=Hibiscus sabdariffa TaxID=183260 RepID=A0ABR2TMA2_9ROSI
MASNKLIFKAAPDGVKRGVPHDLIKRLGGIPWLTKRKIPHSLQAYPSFSRLRLWRSTTGTGTDEDEDESSMAWLLSSGSRGAGRRTGG